MTGDDDIFNQGLNPVSFDFTEIKVAHSCIETMKMGNNLRI